MRQLRNLAAVILSQAPPLPLDDAHWQEVVGTIGLSAQQARILELMLRDLSDLQIAQVLGISESTVKTHQERIRFRTGARGRMQLAMLVLSVSHQVRSEL